MLTNTDYKMKNDALFNVVEKYNFLLSIKLIKTLIYKYTSLRSIKRYKRK